MIGGGFVAVDLHRMVSDCEICRKRCSMIFIRIPLGPRFLRFLTIFEFLASSRLLVKVVFLVRTLQTVSFG